jgi:phosphatidylinositol alpha-1,6-mannosyltransferase
MNKIVILAGDFPPVEGGISIYLQTLARLLSSDEVVVIGLHTPGSSVLDKKQDFRIKRLPIPERWGPQSKQFKFLAPFYFWELIKESNIDYIICGQAHHSLVIPAWLNKKIWGIPFGVIAHGTDICSIQAHFYKRKINSLLRSAQAIFANSRKTAEVVEKTGVQPAIIHIINPMVDMTMQIGEGFPNNIRQTLYLEGEKCLLTVCRLVERKGVDTVIRAMPEILRKVPEAHYIIVGSGVYELELKKLTQTLGLESHIIFVGYIAHEDLSPFYTMCDVFVMTSRDIPGKPQTEGFGLVYLEANLFGKPVVASRSGGIADAVLDGQTGSMVDPDNPSETAAAVVKLLTDKSLARQLGETGRKRVLNEFSGQSAVKKIREIMLSNGGK